MGKPDGFDENGLKKGPWTPEEDEKLVDCIQKLGHGNWKEVPKLAGLNRCGKSCRLRWTNYLRPGIKRGTFSQEEEQIIIDLHARLGNKWSAIASHLPGRTDNEIKNFWNTHIRKKLLQNGIDPNTHMPRTDLITSLPDLQQLLAYASAATTSINPLENALRFHSNATQLAKFLLMQNILQFLRPSGSTIYPPPGAFNPSGVPPELATNQIHHCPNASSLIYDPDMLQTASTFQALNNPQVTFYGENDHAITKFNDHTNGMTNHEIPVLVSSSPPDCLNEEQNKNSINPADFAKSSSASTTFPALEDFMDDETSNYYWKNIIDILQ